MTIVEMLNVKRASPETLLEVMTTSLAEISGDKALRNVVSRLGRVPADSSAALRDLNRDQ